MGLVVLALVCGCASQPRTPDEAMRGAVEGLRDAVLDSVDDPGRQARALALVDDLDREVRDLARANRALALESAQLFANYDTTKRDFDQFLGAVQKGRDRMRQRLLDVRLGLAALLSADEWRALARADSDALAAWATAD